MSLALDVV